MKDKAILIFIVIFLVIALIIVVNRQLENLSENPLGNFGDPDRPTQYYGPQYGDSGSYKAPYGPSYVPQQVPVPQRALKETNERYGYPFRQFEQLSFPVRSEEYFKPYAFNTATNYSGHAGYAQPGYYGRGKFYSSTNAYAPFNEVNSNWEKAGLLSTTNANDDSLLVLYRRPIAPLQDLWEYSAQNKDGIIIPLEDKKLLENDDVIATVPGLESKGSWKVKIYVNNKYIYM